MVCALIPLNHGELLLVTTSSQLIVDQMVEVTLRKGSGSGLESTSPSPTRYYESNMTSR